MAFLVKKYKIFSFQNSQIFQLNEISQDIQISPKSATTNDDDEFEKVSLFYKNFNQFILQRDVGS